MLIESKREVLDHLQYLNLGLASTIRFAKKREDIEILSQSVSEHLVGMLNILDVVKPELDKRHSVDWGKVDKMVRYHDVGEIETGDIVEIKKSEDQKEEELKVVEKLLAGFPGELGGEIAELLREKEEYETLEARIVHIIDKLEPEIIIATERGIQEIKDLHLRHGIDVAAYSQKKFDYLRNILIEWELDVDVLVELVEETWERQVELGILDEDPQLRLELEEEREEK